MAMEEVQVSRQGSLAVLDIRGYVTKTSGVPMKTAFAGLDPAVYRSVLFRFDKETYVNSEGIKTIIDLLLEAGQAGQRVGITGVSDHFEKIFGMVGITKLTRIYKTEEEAVQDLTPEG